MSQVKMNLGKIKKDVTIQVKVTEQMKETAESNALKRNMSFPDYIRFLIMEDTKRIK